ncbi:MAG: hypothetical protein H7226_02345 [Salinibacterium sp.]|nr:hypothetical protein [Salinibacterium sp.]
MQHDFADVGNFRRRVGIIGASKVGARVIELLRPFDFDVVVFGPYLSDAEAAGLGARKLTLDELIETASVVSLHAPRLTSTRHLLSGALLARMPDGATLINTARGGLIDQDALTADSAGSEFDVVQSFKKMRRNQNQGDSYPRDGTGVDPGGRSNDKGRL